jgi:tetratricopeptide (TPR) repeat protein
LASSASGQNADAGPGDLKVREGLMEFQKQNFVRARLLLREALAASPNNTQIWEIEAICSLRLKDYAAAAESTKHALELKPDAGYLLAGLSYAYTRAGMSSERDATRDHIRHLASEGRLYIGFYYVFDSFVVNGHRVEVSEFPPLHGHTEFPNHGIQFEFPNHRYHFDVLNSGEEQLYRIVLASNESDQAKWSTKHAAEAAAGLRVFSLDHYGGQQPGPDGVYQFFDREPSYEQVCDQVKEIVLGTLKPMSGDRYGRRPEPE